MINNAVPVFISIKHLNIISRPQRTIGMIVVILSIYTFSIFIYIIPNRAYHVTEFRMYLIIIKSELIRCSFLAVSKRSKDTSNDPMGVVLPLVSSALVLCNSESSLHRRCIEACTW